MKMLNENSKSRHQPGSILNTSVRILYDEVNFTVHYYKSELQSIAHESSPLNIMLRELKEYSSIIRQGGSVALHRGETLISPKLSK